MASGSYNIDTFSWYRSLPLSTNTTAYSTLTMFAVGPSSFEQAYTFYQYTWSNGFPDTSTFSTSITTFINDSFISTNQSMGKQFVSTVPLTQWISTGNNLVFDYPVSGSVPQIYDYISSFDNATTSLSNPLMLSTPRLYLGEGLSYLINSKQFNVYVESQYSLLLNSNAFGVGINTYNIVSTTGVFNGPDLGLGGNQGRTVQQRVSFNQYANLNQKLAFKPEPFGSETQIPSDSSNYRLHITIPSTINLGGPPYTKYAPTYELFVPGDNNFTFTLVPIASTVTIY